MINKASRIRNTEDIHYFAEDILNRYYLMVKEKNTSEIIKNYIYKLAESCAGILNEDEVWSVIKILNEKDCLVDSVLEKSSIQKFTRMSNSVMNQHVKEELIDLASNKIIRHVNKDIAEIKEYKTECLTIDTKKDSVKIGELICTLEYSDGGRSLNQSFDKNEEAVLDFTTSNVLIKVKEDIINSNINKHVRIVIAKNIEKSK